MILLRGWGEGYPQYQPVTTIKKHQRDEYRNRDDGSRRKPSLLCVHFSGPRWRNLNHMQAALSFCSARPAPRPGIFARTNSPRAMRATDARIILIMERVVRDVMLVEIA